MNSRTSAWDIQALEDQCIIAMADIITAKEQAFLSTTPKAAEKLAKARELEVGALDALNDRLAAAGSQEQRFVPPAPESEIYCEMVCIFKAIENMARNSLGRELTPSETLCLEFDILRESILKSGASKLHVGLLGRTGIEKYVTGALGLVDTVRHELLPDIKPVFNAREVIDVVDHFKGVLLSKFAS